jgi:hypothetical protein
VSVERACVALVRIFNSASPSGGSVGVCPALAWLQPVLPGAGRGVKAPAAEALLALSRDAVLAWNAVNAEGLILQYSMKVSLSISWLSSIWGAQREGWGDMELGLKGLLPPASTAVALRWPVCPHAHSATVRAPQRGRGGG